jgi:hypothetical protein
VILCEQNVRCVHDWVFLIAVEHHAVRLNEKRHLGVVEVTIEVTVRGTLDELRRFAPHDLNVQYYIVFVHLIGEQVNLSEIVGAKHSVVVSH